MSQRAIFIKRGEGGAQPNISKEKIVNTLMPVPPLAEQKRIVEKLDGLSPILLLYEKVEIESRNLNENFPDALKKSILQWAVQGKLVPQDPNDEPASVLLERIRSEKARLVKEGKIKKDKHESVIFKRANSHYEKLDGIERCIDDEIPFEIPESWEWVHLKNVAELQTGTTPSTSHTEYFEGNMPFVKPADITFDMINYFNESLSKSGAVKGRIIPPNSCLMVCIGSIGKCYFTDRTVCCNQQINAATPYCINCKYLWLAMCSDYFQATLKETAGGTVIPIINKSLWSELLIPLPPLAEQHRIVEKIEEILPTITSL